MFKRADRESLEAILRDVQRGFGDHKGLRDEITVIYKRTATLIEGQNATNLGYLQNLGQLQRLETGQNVLKADLDALDKRLSVIETKLCEVMEGNAARAEWMAQLGDSLKAIELKVAMLVRGEAPDKAYGYYYLGPNKPNGKATTGKRSR